MPSILEKGIMKYVDDGIKNSPDTESITGLVASVPSNNSGYGVKINGVTYTHVPSLGATNYNVNDTVIVIIPNGQYNNMYILGKLKYS